MGWRMAFPEKPPGFIRDAAEASEVSLDNLHGCTLQYGACSRLHYPVI
jgi:hypothetical protein